MTVKKRMVLSLPVQQKSSGHHSSRDDFARNIVLGATGLAITAGMVATGAALANSKLRVRLGKAVEKGMTSLSRMGENVPKRAERYIATAHQITRKTNLSGGKKAKRGN